MHWLDETSSIKTAKKLDKKVRQGSIENTENPWHDWTAIRWIKTPCRQVIPVDYEQKSVLDQIANLLEQVRTALT